MIILLWISRLTTSVYTTRGIYALVLDLQREDKVWPRFPSVAGSSWFFPSGQLGSRQSGLYSNVLMRFVSWYYPTFVGHEVPIQAYSSEPSTWLPYCYYVLLLLWTMSGAGSRHVVLLRHIPYLGMSLTLKVCW